MITAISNNFGAGEIQLKDFQKEGLVVLNGAFEFNPANAAYLAAEVLEIKVPELMVSKSTNAVVYLIDMDNEMPHATLMRAWIKDSRTICMEPCRCFDSKSRLQVVFCSGFVAKGQRADRGQTWFWIVLYVQVLLRNLGSSSWIHSDIISS